MTTMVGVAYTLNRLVTLPILSTTWAYVSPALLIYSLDGGGGISYVDAHHPDSLGIILVVDGLKHRLCDLAGGTRDAPKLQHVDVAGFVPESVGVAACGIEGEHR